MHSVIAPSSLSRIVQCPGSVAMARALPPEELAHDEDTHDVAEEGTAAHWALAEMFEGRPHLPGTLAPNGVRLTEEMLDAVEVGYSAVFRYVGPDAALRIERRVSIQRIHDECWGTPDLTAWVGNHLFVFDYKHGFGVVEAYQNWQLLAYAVGLIEEAGKLDTEVSVTAVILQPRAQHREGPVRAWNFRAVDVRALVNIAANAAAEALGTNPRTRAGPGCRYCPARPACPTFSQASSEAMALAHEALPHRLSPGALGVELRFAQQALRLLSARVEALEAQALAVARSGQDVPHYQVVKDEGREVWKVSDAEAVALGQMLGLDFAKPQEAITPLQAKQRGLSDELRARFAGRLKGAAKLVPDDGSKARRVFGG